MAFIEQQKLVASDAAADDRFGHGVSVDDDTCVIGARNDDDKGSNSGSAYVFTRSGATWTQQQKLTASDGAAGDQFGAGVSVDGDTCIVGSPWDNSYRGSAYVFVRSGTAWTEQQKLTASDGAGNDLFGESVAISGDTCIIGSYQDDGKGSAYVFVRSGATWTQQQKLTASDGAAGDRFGNFVDIDDDTCVIGAHYDDDNGSNSGSAYVFARSGATWTQQQKLTASDGAAGDQFGRGVSVDDNTCIASSHLDDDNGADSGSAYIFTRSGTTWTQQQKLTASDGAAGDQFGYGHSGVFISNDTCIVGSPYDDDNGSNSGSAYVFTRTEGVWTERAKLLAGDGAANDEFGLAVSMDSNTCIVGSRLDDDAGGQSGSAYVFFGYPLPYLISSPISPNPGYFIDTPMTWKVGQS